MMRNDVIEAAVVDRRNRSIRTGRLSPVEHGGAYTAATISWDRLTELLRSSGSIADDETVSHLEVEARGLTYVIERKP